jgi:7-cyano-7-deazaguanine synthase
VKQGHAGVLASGGVESAALLRWSLDRYRRVTPLYIRTGTAWEGAELGRLRRLVTAFNAPSMARPVVLEVPVRDVYGRHWSVTGRGVPDADSPDPAVYLPGRNLLLLSKAAVYAALSGIDTLLLGTLKDNPFPDATAAFVAAMTRAVQRGLDTPLRIETPFRDLHKTDVLRMSRDVPWGESFSCIRPVGRRHCGACNKCAERRRGFAEAGIADPTRYATRARM